MADQAPPPADGAALRLGGTQVHERLAVGGMAEVFRGTRQGRDVIVKLLLPRYGGDEAVVALFEHEAALGERLRHPSIVPVLEHGHSARGPYLVCARIDGAPLASLIAKGALSTAATLVLGRDLCDALAFVHDARDERGAPLDIVHRDISPQNVLVDREGRGVLIDFGVARSALRSDRTKTGIVRGKVAYVAPEQVTGSAVDARTDLYALSVVLFEAATGRPYLEGDSELALLRAAEDPVLRAPSSLGAEPILDPLLTRGLARFPEERWSSAAAMRAAFEKLLDEEGEARGREALAARVREVLGAGAARTGEPRARRTPEGPLAGRAPTGLVLRRFGYFAVGLAVSGVYLVARSGREEGTAWRAPGSASGVSAGASSEGEAAPPRLSAASGGPPDAAPANALAVEATSVTSPTSEAPSARSAAPAAPRASAPSAASTAGASAQPSAEPSAVVPSPSGSAASPDRASTQQKIALVNQRIAQAKKDGKDTSAAEAKIPAALDAFMDGRYADSNRELDAILAALK